MALEKEIFFLAQATGTTIPVQRLSFTQPNLGFGSGKLCWPHSDDSLKTPFNHIDLQAPDGKWLT